MDRTTVMVLPHILKAKFAMPRLEIFGSANPFRFCRNRRQQGIGGYHPIGCQAEVRSGPFAMHQSTLRAHDMRRSRLQTSQRNSSGSFRSVSAVCNARTDDLSWPSLYLCGRSRSSCRQPFTVDAVYLGHNLGFEVFHVDDDGLGCGALLHAGTADLVGFSMALKQLISVLRSTIGRK